MEGYYLESQVPLLIGGGGDGDTAIDKTKKSNKGRNDQHLGVESQPGKIKSNLDAKVILDQPKGLPFVPLFQVGPFQVQQLE